MIGRCSLWMPFFAALTLVRRSRHVTYATPFVETVSAKEIPHLRSTHSLQGPKDIFRIGHMPQAHLLRKPHPILRELYL